MKNKINFSVFQIADLTESQMEVVFENLKSKINKKNDMFERMLENQKNSEEGFYNKKTMQIIIQYVLNENIYTIADIKKTVQKTINVFEMMEDNEEEKTNIVTDLITELNLGEIEEFTKYIHKFTMEQYEKMKQILIDEEDIEEILDEMMRPYIEYHFNNSERFVADDLVFDFLVKLNKDKKADKTFFMNKIIDYILGEGKILRLAFIKEDVTVISNYLNVLKIENNKLNIFNREVKEQSNLRIKKNLPKDFKSYKEHSEHMDVSGLNKKSDIKIIEIMYTVEATILKRFFKFDLKYDENKVMKIISNLNKMNIKTFYKLQNLVLKNKFVQMTRQNNRKMLPGKIVKMIVYKILDKSNKLEQLKEQNIDITTDVDILKFEFTKMSVENKKTTIKDMKEQRINLNNLIVLLKENGEDFKNQEEELKKLDNEIKNHCFKMTETDALETNIDDITEMMDTLNLTGSEKAQMMTMITDFKNILGDKDNIYGENFNKENDKIFINRNVDKNLENLIQKYNKENEDEDKKKKKERFVKLQNDLVNFYLKNIIGDIDYQYRVNNIKLYEMISEFIRHQMNTKIIPRIYKNFYLGESKYNKNEVVYHLLKKVIHMFVIMLNFTNKEINYTKVYDSLEKIIRVNENIKKVILKVNGKEAELIKERENDVIVEYLGEQITMKKTEVRQLKDLVGKEIKIIKGNYKGYVGKIYAQKADYVLATKDYYGRNQGTTQLPQRVVIMKLKYDEFKVNETEQRQRFIVEQKELYEYYTNKDKKLYSMTKFEMNKYYMSNEMENFEQLYKLTIELLNDYKTNEYTKYQKIRESKKEYVALKKEIEQNKNNKKRYITLNKKLKKLHKDIRNMEKNMKLIKDTLIDKSDNLNDNYTYVKEDGLFKLKEHMIVIKTEDKVKLTSEEKKKVKKEKLQKEKIQKLELFETMTNEITNMMEDLLL